MLGRVRQILSKRSERVTSSRANPSPPRATATSGSTSDTDTHEIERHSLNLRRTNEETAVEFGRDCERPSDLRQRNTDEPPYGLTILVDQPPGQINSVDIVAIHGLNGHREKTWTDGASGVNWLAHADCLRNDIPCARVLSFGYNSASFFSRGDANIQDFASELLAALKSSRNSSAEKERPIIFICHSLGGLVFKQAVVRAHEQDRFYAQVLQNIKGVVFFATPHRGSDLAYWDLLAARVVKAATIGYTTNTRLSKDLRVSSTTLKRISDSFTYRAWDFAIRSFYETELMPGLNSRVVERDSAILGWGNELDISSPSNHRSICKFASPKDQRYRNAINAICDMIDVPKGATQPSLSTQDVYCLGRLNSNYEEHLEQVDDPVPGTCKWVLSHEKWLRWQSHPGSSLLWITSNAGCGKSVTAKFLAQHLLRRNKRPALIFGYFFFMDGMTGQNNAVAAASALLHQLCHARHDIFKHIARKLEGLSDNAMNKMSVLWSLLIESVGRNTDNDIVWLLDGVEECEAQSFNALIKAISNILDIQSSVGTSLRTGRLKIILLSRPSSIIQNTLGLFADGEVSTFGNRLRLAGENETEALAADISRFAHWKINELLSVSALPKRILEKLNERLVAGADFTFLWISLIVKMVEDSALNGISIADLESILTTTSLDAVYETLLAQPARVFPGKTRKVLSIILAAVRPLTMDELCVAVEIDANNCNWSPGFVHQSDTSSATSDALPKHWKRSGPQHTPPFLSTLQAVYEQLHKPFDNHIRQLCGHFVRIRRGKVYLVHQTARKFLVTKSFELEHERLYLWAPITATEASQNLLNICLNYLQLFISESRLAKRGEPGDWDQSCINHHLESCRNDARRAFYPYAAMNWIHHYRYNRKALDSKYDWMLQPGTVPFETWAKVHWSWIEEHTATHETPGAQWIDQGETYLQNQSFGRLHHHYAQFRYLQKFLNAKWHVRSTVDENKIIAEVGVLKHRFAANPKFYTLKQYFEQNAIVEFIATARTIDKLPIRLSPDMVERYLEEVFEEWNRELQGFGYCKTAISNYKPTKINKPTKILTETHVSHLEAAGRLKEALREALLHFDLLELRDIGFEEDEFLRDYWQSRENWTPFGPRSDQETEGFVSNAPDHDMPDRIKHYIRQKAKQTDEKHTAKNTPGAVLPDISNPEAQRSEMSSWPFQRPE